MSFSAFSVANANDLAIKSSSKGGKWNEPETWIGGKVPLATDDVIIDGDVMLTVDAVCNNLIVNQGKMLTKSKLNSPNIVNLSVKFTIENLGVIRNSNSLSLKIDCENFVNKGKLDENIELYISKNISNSGIWSNNITELSGNGEQQISFDQNTFFGGKYLKTSKSVALKVLLTDIVFVGTTVDFENQGGIKISKNKKMILRKNSICQNVKILGESILSELKLQTGSYITSCNLSDLSLGGTTKVEANIVFNGVVINVDTLQGTSANVNHEINVNGKFVNNGRILKQNGGFNIKFSCFGDIENNGVWENTTISINGKTKQNIVCKKNCFFDNVRLECNAGSSVVNAKSDLVFRSSELDLNHKVFNFTGTNLKLYNSKINNALLVSDTMNNTIHFLGKSSIKASSIRGFSLHGKVQVEQGVVFEARVINCDTLTKFDNTDNCNLEIKGNFVNRGLIYNSAKKFEISTENLINQGTIKGDVNIRINKDFTNIGVCDGIGLVFCGDKSQNIVADSKKSVFDNLHIISDKSTGLNIKNDITFRKSEINLGNNWFSLGKKTNLVFVDGYFCGKMIGETDNSITLRQNSFLRNTTLENLILHGDIQVDTFVCLNGKIVNMDTIQTNKVLNFHRIVINKNFINKGKIFKQTSFDFIFDIYGDIINNGTWIADKINMMAKKDQRISSNSVISCGEFNVKPFFNKVIFVDTDIEIKSSDNVDFNNTKLKLSKGKKISFNGGCLKNIILEGDSCVLSMSNKAYAIHSFIGGMSLKGKVTVGADVTFYKNVYLIDTLEKHVNKDNVKVEIEGQFLNRGKIINNDIFPFHIVVYGDTTGHFVTDNKIIVSMADKPFNRKYRLQVGNLDSVPVYTQVLIYNKQRPEELIYEVSTDAEGRKTVSLDGRYEYEFIIKKDGYYSANIKPNNISGNDIAITTSTYEDLIKGKISINLYNITFDSNKATLSNNSCNTLKILAKDFAKMKSVKIHIRGHTDASGLPKDNLVLSEKRAITVKEYFVKEGCAESMFTIEGCGSTKPYEKGNSPEQRKKNRRIEILFTRS